MSIVNDIYQHNRIMEANQQLQHLSKPIGYSESTGLDIYKSYTAASGFNYFVGIRNLNDLIIMEQVAEGTANTLLCGVLIYHKTDNVLLSEIKVPKLTPYTRVKVVEIPKSAPKPASVTTISERLIPILVPIIVFVPCAIFAKGPP